jgi:aconitate hydratase
MVASRLAAQPLRAAKGISRSSTSLFSRSMASVQSRIGDQQVEMSNLEKGRYINYQRIEDNLQVVRSR